MVNNHFTTTRGVNSNNMTVVNVSQLCQSLSTVARQSDVDSEVVTTFLKNAACHNKLATVQPPEEKGLSFRKFTFMFFGKH